MKGLANAMQYLIEHPEKMKEFGENTHKFVEEELNKDRIVSKIYDEKKTRELK